MLVLRRRVGEKIYIGPDISIVITKIKGPVVSISVEAPSHVHIRREELTQDHEPPSDRSA